MVQPSSASNSRTFSSTQTETLFSLNTNCPSPTHLSPRSHCSVSKNLTTHLDVRSFTLKNHVTYQTECIKHLCDLKNNCKVTLTWPPLGTKQKQPSPILEQSRSQPWPHTRIPYPAPSESLKKDPHASPDYTPKTLLPVWDRDIFFKSSRMGTSVESQLETTPLTWENSSLVCFFKCYHIYMHP